MRARITPRNCWRYHNIVDCVCVCVCVKLSAGKSEPASSASLSRSDDKQLGSSESGSSLDVSSSRRRQRHFGKLSRKRPAEVFVVTIQSCFILNARRFVVYATTATLSERPVIQDNMD